MDRKKSVLDIVERNPGIRFNEIMRISNIRNGTLSHYVKKLEEEKTIQLERSPRVTRLYPSGIDPHEAKICKYLTMETQKKIILLLLNKETATAVEIRDILKKSPSVISVNLTELFREKIVEKQYDIPSNRYSLKQPDLVSHVLRAYFPGYLDKTVLNTVELLDF